MPAVKSPSKTTSASQTAISRQEASITPEQHYQMIAEAAYFRAERQGFHGNPAQDWLDAEAEIDRVLHHPGKAGLSPKQIFQQKLEAQLRELDTAFDELKLQASLAKAELRTEFEKQLEVLAAKRTTAQTKLGELSRRTESAWEDLKGGAEKAWDDMRQTLNQVASRFK